MNRFLALALLALVWPAAVFAQTTGVERMTNLWQLPQLDLGVVSFGESSHDRLGLNQDGFIGLYSRLYRENGQDVLFDAQGPGCVYRLWFTFTVPPLATHLQFYVDDNPQPVVDQKISQFFAGRTAPFLEPLVWDNQESSGGFVSYVPICYRQRLKIVTTFPITFYNVTAHQYRADTEVASFTGNEDYAAVRALYDSDRAGQDPKDTTGVGYDTQTLVLPAGATTVFYETGEAGQIASLRLTPAAIDSSLLNQIRLRAYFNGEEAPSVDTELGLFFGATQPNFDVSSLLFGIRDSVLYSFFPMPYFAGARLELVNQSDANVTLSAEVGVLPEMPSDYAGTFSTVTRVSSPPVLMGDHHFADPTGQGKIVGVIQFAGGYSGQGYLEGDERYYPDGLLSPTIHGTGTEDYYNGGWYFAPGLFSLPTHGHPQRSDSAGLDVTAMYRLHLADTLEFYRGAVFSIEHDAYNLDVDEVERTTAFLYRVPEEALVLEADFDVGEPAEEDLYRYAGTDDETTGPQYFFYEGDNDFDGIIDWGYESAGVVQFTVPVNPHNDGVRLVRRLDQFRGREAIEVLVNGEPAGTWYTAARNPFKRWRDAVYDLPPALTKGHSSLEITLINASDEGAFSQYRYWVYSWKRPLLTRLGDLTLSSPATEVTIGDAVQLYVDGAYPSGNREEITGWVDFSLSDSRLASERHGLLRTKTAGTLTVKAVLGERESNEITITIVPPSAGNNDYPTSDNDAGDDDAATADDDDEGGCGC